MVAYSFRKQFRAPILDGTKRQTIDGWPQMQAFWREYHPLLPVFTGVVVRWAELEARA